MKKTYIAILAAAIPAAAMAQSAIDAQQVSQGDFKGSARYMSMGGAFTALGGDLTAINQNPAGIGIYRSSELGVTIDLNFQSTSTSPSYPEFKSTNSQTKFFCNNFGYVGSTLLPGALRSFNWGVSYNKLASFDRVYRGYSPRIGTSLSNYIADYTTASGVSTSDMTFGTGYNPYLDSSVDWLSILAYTTYMINPVGNGYVGLYGNGTEADALWSVKETGGIDEYNISFGGNVENVVYWGLGIGITDLHYTRSLIYSESMDNAQVASAYSNTPVPGNAGFEESSRKYINGSGWNLKLGLIIKPVNEFRLGLAIHTPTWYKFTQGYDGIVDFSYLDTGMPQSENNPLHGNDYTEDAYFNWNFRSPWKMMVGVAGVIGGRAIISADYQYDAYGDMRISTPVYGGYQNSFEQNDYLNGDIKDYFKASNTVRLGLEYRLTPQVSLRAGYNVKTTNVQNDAADGSIEVLTSGTDASYTFDKTTQNISLGLGYRYKAWYIDAAYVYTNRESTFHAFTNFNGNVAPQWKLADKQSSVIISTGIKF